MQTYLLLLVTVSLVLVAVYLFLGKSIPVETPVYYLSVGFSLALSLLVPYFLSALNAIAVIIVYVLLILFFGFALTMVWEKFFRRPGAREPGDPENKYVGKKVGLLTTNQETPGATFAEVLVKHVGALLPTKARPANDTGETVPDADPLESFPPGSPPPGPEPTEEPVAPEDHVPEDLPGPYAANVDPRQGAVPENPDAEQPGAPDEPVAPPQESPEPEPPRGDPPAKREEYATVLRGLFQALGTRPPLEERARLTARVSAVYQELGQYWQAVEVVRTFLADTGGPADDETLNSMIVRAAHCQAILRTLQEEGLDPVPYAGLADDVRTRAAKLAGRLILEGGWQGEEIA